VLIDCATCSIRGEGCSQCVIAVVLDAPTMFPYRHDLDESERKAVAVLTAAGLLPAQPRDRSPEPVSPPVTFRHRHTA
jgi:hypothetical protein